MHTHQTVAKLFERKDLPESEVELTGEIPAEALEEAKKEAIKHIAEHLELPGFRAGHVPEALALQKVGDIAVLEEAVEIYMREFYPALIEYHAINAVGRPSIGITKLAPNNPAGLVIRTTVYPTITVPAGWEKLAQEVPADAAPEVTDKDLDEALTSIRRARAKSAASETGTPTDPSAPVAEEALPELNDEFAKSLGSFESLEDLKTKLRENLVAEKTQALKDKRRGALIEKLIEKATIEVPRLFVESELEKIMGQLKDDITRFGMSMEDYLKRVEKTEEDVRNDFREQAMKRAKLQLLLNKLAEEEKVEADKEAVDEEMKHGMEHFPDANPELMRVHIETVLRNEKVLQLLEAGK